MTAAKPPAMSKLLLLLGAISVLAPFSIDMYLPAMPAIAADLNASAGAIQSTLPAFFVGMASASCCSVRSPITSAAARRSSGG